MLNLVVLTGRLTTDPEIKFTQQNSVAVTSFTIAVQRKYSAGQEKATDFINIVAWRNTAEFICKYFKKGKMIAIEGSIQVRNYEDNEGNKRKAFEIVASAVDFVGNKDDDGQSDNSQEVKVPRQKKFEDYRNVNDGDLPF